VFRGCEGYSFSCSEMPCSADRITLWRAVLVLIVAMVFVQVSAPRTSEEP